jgi:hypothetical protein
VLESLKENNLSAMRCSEAANGGGSMAVLGSAALLTAEVNAGIEVFKLLEPEIQKGFIGLFHLFHHKQLQVNKAQTPAPTSAQGISSARTDPLMSSTD